MALELRALWLEGVKSHHSVFKHFCRKYAHPNYTQIGEFHASNLPHVGLDCWAATINIARDPRWYIPSQSVFGILPL